MKPKNVHAILSVNRSSVILSPLACILTQGKESSDIFVQNKNALSSSQSRLLRHWIYCQLVVVCYIFVWNTKRVLCVIMYGSKRKIYKERQAAHLSFTPVWSLWKPSAYWYCSSWENSFTDFTKNWVPGILKTGLAKKSTHSTPWQLKTIKNHSKAD